MSIPTETLVWSALEKRFDDPHRRVSDDHFLLLGRVPLSWLAKASRLPGKALAVGLSIWSLALAVKSMTVMVTSQHLEPFGIDAPAKSRALTALSKAGLISVERRRGRFPLVTLTSV